MFYRINISIYKSNWHPQSSFLLMIQWLYCTICLRSFKIQSSIEETKVRKFRISIIPNAVGFKIKNPQSTNARILEGLAYVLAETKENLLLPVSCLVLFIITLYSLILIQKMLTKVATFKIKNLKCEVLAKAKLNFEFP